MKTILLTHPHRDHYGGLVDASGKAAFPNAAVYVSRAERAYWVDEKKDVNVIHALAQYAGRVHEFEPGDKVMPGVKALDTSGHTPGHVSFLLKNGRETLLILGDLIHFPRIQLPLPEVAVRYDVDPDKAVQARKRIFDYACENKIPVAGMHIPFPGTLKLKKTGNASHFLKWGSSHHRRSKKRKSRSEPVQGSCAGYTAPGFFMEGRIKNSGMDVDSSPLL